ncbi:phage tail protein, partial [Paraclostridium sordellii]|uniref:phage tail protein n=2 Tax=Clostridia TaxID=186801 RepID=UPI002ED16FD8
TNVSAWITNIVTYFTQLPGQIWTWLTNCVTNMTTWGGNMLTEAKTGMTDVFNGIVDTFTNLPSKMMDIGKNIVAGIKQGISDAWNGMKGWIGGLCDSFIDGVKEKMDIHSPSRVMRQLGVYTGEGFGLGIGDTVNSISKQANAIAEAAIPNVNAGNFDMSVSSNPIGGNNIGSTGSNMDMLLAKMDEMTKAIANMKVLIDGRPAGKILTPYISNNLAFNNGRKGF